MVFLETAAISGDAFGGAMLGGLLAAGIFFVFMFFLLMVGIYVYTSFAYMAIARKAKLSSPGLAWIPGIGPLIITYKASKMHWWPWLLFIGFIIPFVNFIAIIIFEVFAIIWLWKTFQAVKRPGWWAIVSLIPVVNLILLGIAAWSD